MSPRTATAATVRCAIYTRQSVARAGADPAVASCELQYEACRAFVRDRASLRWLALDERFDDEGFSGATMDRPALERLLDRLLAGEVDRVVVYRLDRLTRRLADWARLSAAFEERGVGLTVVRGGFTTAAGSAARFQLNMLAAFAELERDMIAERLTDDRAARQARGERSAGRLPLGYSASPFTKQLVINEIEAATVRWFFTEAANGATAAALATRANVRKVSDRSGRQGHWSARTVLRLLQNRAYLGQRPDGSHGVHDAIIDSDTFARVQEAIATRRTRQASPRPAATAEQDPFVLRGLLVCVVCGKHMTTSTSRSIAATVRRDGPRYYRCRTAGCSGGQVAGGDIESFVLELLQRPSIELNQTTRQQCAILVTAWDNMWPTNKRAALGTLVESIRWDAKRGTVSMVLKD